MIKTKFAYNIDVIKDWGSSKLPPLFKNQLEITGENLFFPNIIITSQKGSGKTVLAVNLIRRFAMNKTKIIIFSTTFSIGDDKDAFDDLEKMYPGILEVHKRLIDKDGSDILAKKIDEAKERYEFIKKKNIIILSLMLFFFLMT